MSMPVDPDEVRELYDFADPRNVAEIAKLAAEGCTDRIIAHHFGYRSAVGFMTALDKPEHRAAIRALRSARVEAERKLLGVAWEIALDPAHKQCSSMVRWLSEKRLNPAEGESQSNVVPIRSPLGPEDSRALMRVVRDAQRATG